MKTIPFGAAVAALCALLLFTIAPAAQFELFVDSSHPLGEIDMTRYALGQGGLSREPMFDSHREDVAALRPQTIRLFVQEYFDLYPARGRYHWDTLDRSIRNILATGAEPILSLCFKPRVLFPYVDQDSVVPTDYAEWEALIEALVRHCNTEMKYGIEYWEVGNEVDIGEMGGCPYRFKPADYVEYYRRTAAAIRRADPGAKVGGPALANYTHPIGDALIEFCGKGGAPLDFFSWHLYGNNPQRQRASIREIKAKLARWPSLAATETIIDEWNIQLLGREAYPGFQAAHLLESTLGFLEEGLSRSAYYHIRDYFVIPEDFAWMSPEGYKFMADWWNVQVQNSGLFDNQGQRRPAWYSFRMLRDIQGLRLPVSGLGEGVQALASLNDSLINVVLWNAQLPDSGSVSEISLRLPDGPGGQFRLLRLDAPANRLEELRRGEIQALKSDPLRLQLAPCGVAWLRVDLSGKGREME